ncbi:membrane protein, putative [Pseudomonas fluorescens Q2-87]|uniref:Membrane protein, putative n=2 Tax=Pseudomonas TaxID=286 RepID=J2Y2C5_PSEFQ|nr:membrane protein, putative [Pseudomonas fluorescens Q2-87]
MRPGSVLRQFTCDPWPVLLAMAGLGLALSVYNDINTNGPAFCVTANGLSIFTSWPAALQAELALNPPQRILAGWALMLLAMMPPLLATPLTHVWRSSLPNRRIQASVGFLLGYAAMWMAAGPLLIALALLLQMAAAENTLAVALLVAMLWSASPWHRAALDRGHRMGQLSLFGWAADRDCLIRGLAHGLFCIVSCWAWMLVPLVSGSWHIPMMLLAGAILLAERLIPAKAPRWS